MLFFSSKHSLTASLCKHIREVLLEQNKALLPSPGPKLVWSSSSSAPPALPMAAGAAVGPPQAAAHHSWQPWGGGGRGRQLPGKRLGDGGE